jgi:hypothetical protein
LKEWIAKEGLDYNFTLIAWAQMRYIGNSGRHGSVATTYFPFDFFTCGVTAMIPQQLRIDLFFFYGCWRLR